VRIYDRLFTARLPGSGERTYSDDLNPESCVEREAVLEPWLMSAAPGERFQFERQGYFVADEVTSRPGAPSFHRIVTLRDSWSSKQAEAASEPEVVEAARSAKAKTRPQRRTAAELRELARSQDPALAARMARFQGALGLEEADADVLSGDAALADFFEAALSVHADAALVARWVINEVLRERKDGDMADLRVDGAAFGELVALVADQTLSATAAKEVFAQMVVTGQRAAAVVEEKGLRQVSDAGALDPALDGVLAAWPEEVARYRAGSKNLLGFLMGHAMRATGGKANPKVVQELLRQKLG
jgi:glutaminyl-tRNA synthetase